MPVDLITTWPIVGAGTVDDPYRDTYMPVSIQGQARLLLYGITCFDPSTGTASVDFGTESVEVITRAEKIGVYGPHNIMLYPAVSETWFNTTTTLMHGFQPYGQTVSELIDHIAARLAERKERLQNWKPTLPWDVDDITAAIDVIDTLATNSSTNADLVHQYYANVINPDKPTPAAFPGLTRGDGFDVALAQSLDVADNLARAVRVGDIGYEVVRSVELLEYLPELI